MDGIRRCIKSIFLLSAIAFVYHVVDGDTIDVQLDSGAVEDRVRLIGVNAPERGEPGYKEAKEYLKERLLYQVVWIETDVEYRDSCRRLLGYVWLDGVMINLQLVKKDLAVVADPEYYGDNVKYLEELKEAEGE